MARPRKKDEETQEQVEETPVEEPEAEATPAAEDEAPAEEPEAEAAPEEAPAEEPAPEPVAEEAPAEEPAAEEERREDGGAARRGSRRSRLKPEPRPAAEEGPAGGGCSRGAYAAEAEPAAEEAPPTSPQPRLRPPVAEPKKKRKPRLALRASQAFEAARGEGRPAASRSCACRSREAAARARKARHRSLRGDGQDDRRPRRHGEAAPVTRRSSGDRRGARHDEATWPRSGTGERDRVAPLSKTKSWRGRGHGGSEVVAAPPCPSRTLWQAAKRRLAASSSRVASRYERSCVLATLAFRCTEHELQREVNANDPAGYRTPVATTREPARSCASA